jgi:hypothetical protein
MVKDGSADMKEQLSWHREAEIVYGRTSKDVVVEVLTQAMDDMAAKEREANAQLASLLAEYSDEPVLHGIGAKMICHDDRPLVHVGGYRTAPLARVEPAPRRGFRGLLYLGNALALRARPTSLRRLAWAWLRGAVARIWSRNRTNWELGFLDKSEGVTRPLKVVTKLKWRRVVTSTPQTDATVRDAMTKDCYTWNLDRLLTRSRGPS